MDTESSGTCSLLLHTGVHHHLGDRVENVGGVAWGRSCHLSDQPRQRGPLLGFRQVSAYTVPRCAHCSQTWPKLGSLRHGFQCSVSWQHGVYRLLSMKHSYQMGSDGEPVCDVWAVGRLLHVTDTPWSLKCHYESAVRRSTFSVYLLVTWPAIAAQSPPLFF